MERADRGSRWQGRVGAAAAGAVPVLAFPEPSWWWLAWVGLVPAIVVVAAAGGTREAAFRAWSVGTGFMVAMHHWLAPNIGPGMVVFGVLLGALWVPWGIAVQRAFSWPVTPRRVVGGAAVAASAWLLAEMVRSWSALGGPWGLLGATQWNHPPTLALAALGGVWGVGVAIVSANVALAHLVRRGGTRGVRLTAAAVAVAALVAGPAVDIVRGEGGGAGSVRVAVVQPGVASRAERLARSLASTEGLAGTGVDLAVWGESSVGFDLDAHPDVEEELRRVSGAIGAPVLVNVDARRPGGDGIFKTSALVDESGVRGVYDKMRLVPFGEYIPFRFALGWLAGLSEAADENRRRGTDPVVLPLDGVGIAVGPLVCFESAFPDMSAHLARRGADVLVVQSATSTFQGSWAPEQHAALAAVRAVESGRPVIHAALTGASTVFDEQGRRLASMPTSQRGVAMVEVPLAGTTTAFTRWPHAVPAAAALVGAVALAGMARRARRWREPVRSPA